MTSGRHAAGIVATRRSTELLALWHRYEASHDRSDRNDLIVALLPTIRRAVDSDVHGLGSCVDPDDLMSVAVLAVIQVIDRYDPTRSALRSFVWSRVLHALLDEARRQDWASRSVRSLARRLDRADWTLTARLGRRPSNAEIAGELGWSTGAVIDARDRALLAGVVSLDQPIAGTDGDGTMSLIDTIAGSRVEDCPVAHLMKAAERDAVLEAIDRLPGRHRAVLSMLDVQGWAPACVGEFFGVSRSRVSQMHADARERLRWLLIGPPRRAA